MNSTITQSYLNDLTYAVNGAAIRVHQTFGPGLLESVYQRCLLRELDLIGLSFQSEVLVPLEYRGLKFKSYLKCDILVEKILVIELKSAITLAPIHKAQLLTYMKLLNAPKGILYNFNVVNLYKEGQRTYVNHIFKNLPKG